MTEGGAPASLDGALRGLLREVVREIVREELAVALTRPTPPSVPDAPRYLTTHAAAEMAGVAGKTIRAWVRRGQLRAHFAGRLLRIERRELERFLAGEGGDGQRVDVDAVAAKILQRGRP